MTGDPIRQTGAPVDDVDLLRAERLARIMAEIACDSALCERLAQDPDYQRFEAFITRFARDYGVRYEKEYGRDE